MLPDEQYHAVIKFAVLSAGVDGGAIESALAVSARQAELGSKAVNRRPNESAVHWRRHEFGSVTSAESA